MLFITLDDHELCCPPRPLPPSQQILTIPHEHLHSCLDGLVFAALVTSHALAGHPSRPKFNGRSLHTSAARSLHVLHTERILVPTCVHRTPARPHAAFAVHVAGTRVTIGWCKHCKPGGSRGVGG
jgi:hypothetical protein